MTTIGVDKATELGPKDFERLLLRTLSAMRKGDFSGKEGKLSQRAQVPAAGGRWSVMTDSVNNR